LKKKPFQTGEVKQALGSYESAVLFVLAKFILFNLCAVLVVVIFQTPSLQGIPFTLFLALALNRELEVTVFSEPV
jgi:hypothetical protein